MKIDFCSTYNEEKINKNAYIGVGTATLFMEQSKKVVYTYHHHTRFICLNFNIKIIPPNFSHIYKQ